MQTINYYILLKGNFPQEGIWTAAQLGRSYTYVNSIACSLFYNFVSVILTFYNFIYTSFMCVSILYTLYSNQHWH
jgi:hypothetical protein